MPAPASRRSPPRPAPPADPRRHLQPPNPMPVRGLGGRPRLAAPGSASSSSPAACRRAWPGPPPTPARPAARSMSATRFCLRAPLVALSMRRPRGAPRGRRSRRRARRRPLGALARPLAAQRPAPHKAATCPGLPHQQASSAPALDATQVSTPRIMPYVSTHDRAGTLRGLQCSPRAHLASPWTGVGRQHRNRELLLLAGQRAF
jgi:hypothetical protein